MPRRDVAVKGRTYTIAPDDSGAPGGRWWGVTQAHLVDELTGEAPRGRVVLERAGAGMTSPSAVRATMARVAADGVVGYVGRPSRVFPALRTQGYAVGMTVRVPGYVPRRLERTLGPQPTFPADFDAADFGDVAMHREPIVIQGRTVERILGGTVDADLATVRITGIWRTLPKSHVVAPPAAPADLVSIEPTLYSPRTSPAGQLRAITLGPVPLDDRQLLEDAAAGSRTIRVSNRVNLTAPAVVRIDEPDTELVEHLPVTAVNGGADDVDAATVTLAHPLARPHRRGVHVRRVTPQLPGAANALAADAIAGDRCLLLNGMTGLAAATAVEISGGGGAPEYHVAEPFEATSHEGAYRLPPLSRVAQIEVVGTFGPLAPVTQIVSLDYTVREQRIDFVFA